MSNFASKSMTASNYTSYSTMDETMKYIREYINDTRFGYLNAYYHDTFNNIPKHRNDYNNLTAFPSYSTIGSRDIEVAIQNILTNPKLLAQVLTDDYNIRRIIELLEGENKREAKKLDQKYNTHAEDQNNGIDHTKYEESIDILEEFIEIGLDNLDEEQTEIYEEALEIVQQYEKI